MSTRKVAVMGLIALLLSACGGRSDEIDVPTGEAGLTQVKDEAVGLIGDIAQQIAQDTDSRIGPAVGAYRSTGYSGRQQYYEFVADVALSGGTYDAAAITEIFEQAGLEVSASEDPNGDTVLLGRGGPAFATVRTRPDDTVIRLRVVGSGATLESPSSEQSAELRQETPIDID